VLCYFFLGAHPYSYRQVFLEMGYAEMPTNNFVESSFWNFDALFQPQQHPARDSHDTFFLANPPGLQAPAAYVERVRAMHEAGGAAAGLGARRFFFFFFVLLCFFFCVLFFFFFFFGGFVG
jgi:hypothetical protein